MKKVTAIIVDGTFNRDNTIDFKAHLGYYPIQEDGKKGFFVKESVIETGTTEPIELDQENFFFKNKFNGAAEIITCRID